MKDVNVNVRAFMNQRSRYHRPKTVRRKGMISRRILVSLSASLAVAVLAFVAHPTQADVLVAFDFTPEENRLVTPSAENDWQTLEAIPAQVHPNALAGNLTVGDGIIGSAQGESGLVTASSFSSIAADGTSDEYSVFLRGTNLSYSEADALADNDYVTFTVAPGDDLSLKLAELKFRFGIDGWQSQEATVFVRSSLDGFSSNLATKTVIKGDSLSENGRHYYDWVNVDLNGLDEVAQEVEFRLYTYMVKREGDTSKKYNILHRFDNIEVTVPEPATLVLLGLGAVLIPRRRKVL